ncbi:MAG TPA: hypothetical protein DEQ55_20705 [Pseudomonas sp.]|nr:hypothetical protein [Pseudomonas sp.]
MGQVFQGEQPLCQPLRFGSKASYGAGWRGPGSPRLKRLVATKPLRGCDNCRATATKTRASQPVVRRLDAEAGIENGLPRQQDCRLASRCGGGNGNE